MELPERAVWPLPPRPEVFPWPLDSPWPRRFRRCLAPGRGLRSCKRIKLSGGNNHGSCLRLFGRLNRKSAAAVNILAQAKLPEALQGRLDHVGRILGTKRLA